jgi:hypothetical protein
VRQAAAYRDVISGVILVLVIIFRPKGILGGGGLAIIRPRWWPAAWSLRKHGAAAEA